MVSIPTLNFFYFLQETIFVCSKVIKSQGSGLCYGGFKTFVWEVLYTWSFLFRYGYDFLEPTKSSACELKSPVILGFFQERKLRYAPDSFLTSYLIDAIM